MIPYKITTFDAASAIKDAAKTKDPVHYAEIVDVDLIAKEYKVHKPCYKKFVKGVSATTSRSEEPANRNEQENDSPPYESSNFDEVKEFISDVVLNDQRAVSMSSLHAIYGLGIGN